METLLQDIRVTLRAFRRSPGFPLTAIATLALGIGATTAIFTTLSAVLLKPLPYPNPQDLYSLRTALTDGRVTTGLLSGGEIYRLNDPKLSIERAAGFQPGDLTLLAADGTPSHVTGRTAVTEGFFELFGLPMTMGGFSHDDFTPFPPPPPNAPPQQGPLPTVVISTRLWKQLYNSDPAVVGKPIHFAEFNSTISGVAPRDLDIPHGADIFFAQRTPSTDVNHGQEAFIRLRHGATIERAKSEMATVMGGLATDFPASDRNRVYVSQPLVDVDRRRPGADPDHRHVGDRAAAPPRVRERRQPAARARRGAGARDGRARGARRGMGPARSPARSPSRWCWRPRARSSASASGRWVSARCSRSARRSCRASTPCRSMRACCSFRSPCSSSPARSSDLRLRFACCAAT